MIHLLHFLSYLGVASSAVPVQLWCSKVPLAFHFVRIVELFQAARVTTHLCLTGFLFQGDTSCVPLSHVQWYCCVSVTLY